MAALDIFDRPNLALFVTGIIAGLVIGIVLPPPLLWIRPYLAVVALAPLFIRTGGVLRYLGFAAAYCALTFVMLQLL